jgi:hypothetical protein
VVCGPPSGSCSRPVGVSICPISTTPVCRFLPSHAVLPFRVCHIPISLPNRGIASLAQYRSSCLRTAFVCNGALGEVDSHTFGRGLPKTDAQQCLVPDQRVSVAVSHRPWGGTYLLFFLLRPGGNGCCSGHASAGGGPDQTCMRLTVAAHPFLAPASDDDGCCLLAYLPTRATRSTMIIAMRSYRW